MSRTKFHKVLEKLYEECDPYAVLWGKDWEIVLKNTNPPPSDLFSIFVKETNQHVLFDHWLGYYIQWVQYDLSLKSKSIIRLVDDIIAKNPQKYLPHLREKATPILKGLEFNIDDMYPPANRGQIEVYKNNASSSSSPSSSSTVSRPVANMPPQEKMRESVREHLKDLLTDPNVSTSQVMLTVLGQMNLGAQVISAAAIKEKNEKAPSEHPRLPFIRAALEDNTSGSAKPFIVLEHLLSDVIPLDFHARLKQLFNPHLKNQTLINPTEADLDDEIRNHQATQRAMEEREALLNRTVLNASSLTNFMEALGSSSLLNENVQRHLASLRDPIPSLPVIPPTPHPSPVTTSTTREQVTARSVLIVSDSQPSQAEDFPPRTPSAYVNQEVDGLFTMDGISSPLPSPVNSRPASPAPERLATPGNSQDFSQPTPPPSPKSSPNKRGGDDENISNLERPLKMRGKSVALIQNQLNSPNRRSVRLAESTPSEDDVEV
jgi:hypothetical protein